MTKDLKSCIFHPLITLVRFFKSSISLLFTKSNPSYSQFSKVIPTNNAIPALFLIIASSKTARTLHLKLLLLQKYLSLRLDFWQQNETALSLSFSW